MARGTRTRVCARAVGGLLLAVAAARFGGPVSALADARGPVLPAHHAVERAAANAVRDAYPDQRVGEASCERRPRSGNDGGVSCLVAVGDVFTAVRVTPLRAKGHLQVTSTVALVVADRAEALVANNATLPATADCGEAAIVVVVPGDTFTCTARFGDGTVQQVRVLVRDTAGDAVVAEAQ